MQPDVSFTPPHRRRTQFIVLLVVGALVVLGGVTALVLLSGGGGSGPAKAAAAPTVRLSPSAGRYQTLINCGKLTASPFTFDPANDAVSQHNQTTKVCMGTAGEQRITVGLNVFSGPDGVSDAVKSSSWATVTNHGIERVDGTGFENAPFIGDVGDYGPDCVVVYRRSNELVQINFPDLPAGIDTSSCVRLTMPWTKQLYALIG